MDLPAVLVLIGKLLVDRFEVRVNTPPPPPRPPQQRQTTSWHLFSLGDDTRGPHCRKCGRKAPWDLAEVCPGLTNER